MLISGQVGIVCALGKLRTPYRGKILNRFGGYRMKAKLLLVTALLGLGMTLSDSGATARREITAMDFPKVREQSDLDDILSDYEVYLNFILEVGNQTNRKQAERLNAIYRNLKKKDEAQAARFLRGLRFEMVQKLEMTGLTPERASTNNTAIRQWVTKFLPVWLREADEYQFRSRTNAIVKR